MGNSESNTAEIWCIGDKFQTNRLTQWQTGKNIVDIVPQNNFIFCVQGQHDKIYISTKKGLSKINCFKNASYIKLKRICKNWSKRHGIFWITVENKIYYTPSVYGTTYYPINQLSKCHISDIHIGGVGINNVYALRDNSGYILTIINRFKRQEFSQLFIPHDICRLIILFHGANYVYQSSFGCSGDRFHVYAQANQTPRFIYKKDSWTVMKFFQHKNVIQLSSGLDYCLFLDATGNVYGCGHNEYGQVHVGIDNLHIQAPMQIIFPIKTRIRIKKLACGLYHNLAIDEEFGNVYSWGWNKHGQCGHSAKYGLNAEQASTGIKMVEILEEFICKDIECGGYHSFVKTDNDKYFLFGNNEYGQCSLGGNYSPKNFTFPWNLTDVIDKIKGEQKLKKICLGIACTLLIIQNN